MDTTYNSDNCKDLLMEKGGVNICKCQPNDRAEQNQSEIPVVKYGDLKRIVLVLAGLNIVLIIVCIAALVFATLKRSDNFPATSGKDVKNTFYDVVSTDSVASIVDEHFFCVSCDSVKEAEHHFFDSSDGKRCCVKNMSTLIRLLKYTFVKNLNQYSSDVSSMKSNLDELKEDVHNLETALFRMDRSNQSIELDTDTPTESLIRAKVETNNRLINILLNRRRSVLHLSGTARPTEILWEEETKDGYLSYETDGIHVQGGGKFILYCNIHFTKEVCDRNEHFEYFISQEFSPGEFFPVARAREACVNGSSVDTGLFLQSIISVELGQSTVLRVQYDNNNHKFISKRYKQHTIGIFEI